MGGKNKFALPILVLKNVPLPAKKLRNRQSRVYSSHDAILTDIPVIRNKMSDSLQKLNNRARLSHRTVFAGLYPFVVVER